MIISEMRKIFIQRWKTEQNLYLHKLDILALWKKIQNIIKRISFKNKKNILFPLIAFCFKFIQCHWYLSLIQLCLYIILVMLIKKKTKNQKKKKKKHILHMQTTPDDGLWKVRKHSGQFW